MKALAILFFAMSLAACAGSKSERPPSSIILVRQGGFSGLEERFSIQENGRTTKTMRFPGKPETTATDTVLPSELSKAIFSYIDNNIDSLRRISIDQKGNLTTTLILNHNNQPKIFTWPNLEPPMLSSRKLDTLYALVAPVPDWLAGSK